MEIETRVAVSTVSVVEPLIPAYVAEICVEPSSVVVTTPAFETVPIAEFDEVQTTWLVMSCDELSE